MRPYSVIVGLFNDGYGRYVEVLEHELHELIRVVLKNIDVDEKWYCETYVDVRDAIQNNQVSSAKEHYVKVGYFENRLPHPVVVDAVWYMQQNPDVAEGIRLGNIESAEQHFYRYGFKEGRLPSHGWSLLGQSK
jgi:hypothetical protein